MTAISLAYGKGGLDIELPADRTVVVEPAYAAAAPDQRLEGMPALLEPVTGPGPRQSRLGGSFRGVLAGQQ